MTLDHNATPTVVPSGRALLLDPKLVEVFLDIAPYRSLATR